MMLLEVSVVCWRFGYQKLFSLDTFRSIFDQNWLLWTHFVIILGFLEPIGLKMSCFHHVNSHELIFSWFGVIFHQNDLKKTVFNSNGLYLPSLKLCLSYYGQKIHLQHPTFTLLPFSTPSRDTLIRHSPETRKFIKVI